MRTDEVSRSRLLLRVGERARMSVQPKLKNKEYILRALVVS